VSCVHCVKVTVRLAGSCREGLMASWSSGLGSPGFCSEMSLPALWSDCIKKCSYGVNREVFLRGLRKVIHCFFYGTIFVLIVEDMESICRLRVVTFDIAGVILVALLCWQVWKGVKLCYYNCRQFLCWCA